MIVEDVLKEVEQLHHAAHELHDKLSRIQNDAHADTLPRDSESVVGGKCPVCGCELTVWTKLTK